MQDSFCDFLRSFLSMCFWLLYLTIRVKKNFNALISISLGLNYEFNKIKLEKDRIERIVLLLSVTLLKIGNCYFTFNSQKCFKRRKDSPL